MAEVPVILHPSCWPERSNWYYGLATQPLLLARSPNGIPFAPHSRIDWGFPGDKVLYPIDPTHPICALWRAGLDEEVIAILRELLPSAWSVIPLRIGEHPPEAHTVLYIAAEEESATAEQAQVAVDRLVHLLETKGLGEVDVEIHESSFLELGRLYDHTATEFWCYTGTSYADFWAREEREIQRRFSPALGAQISLLSDRMRCGTAGIWIVCGPPEARRRFLMTCGHLLRPQESRATASHPAVGVRGGTNEPVVQFLGVDYENTLKFFRGQTDHNLQHMWSLKQDFWRASECSEKAPTPEEARRARTEYRQSAMALSRFTRRFGEPSRHTIGHTEAFNIERYIAHQGALWSCDWCLIRPDPDAFTGLSVNIAAHLDYRSLPSARRSDFGWTTIPDTPDALRPKNQVQLEGFCLTGDIFDIPAARSESRRLRKIGATSGDRNCVNSVLEARVRVGKDAADPWTSQMVVFNAPNFGRYRDIRQYSEPGDSGAVVVDVAGDVLGMVTAGQGRRHPDPDRQSVDLTFVTPIDAIFRDLERAGFENPVLAPAGLF